MLPSVLKYPEETWEWTIGRDSKDRISGTFITIRMITYSLYSDMFIIIKL